MNRKKIVLILLFLLLLTGLRFSWLHLFDRGQATFIENGQVDLVEQGMESQEIMKLEGEWSFFPEQLIPPQEMNDTAVTEDKVYRHFPDQWFAYIKNQSFSYGTFQLHATIDESLVNHPLAIYMPRFPSASKIYVNGELVGQAGAPSVILEEFSSRTLPYYVIFQTESANVDISIQVSHDSKPVKFGEQPILFGPADDIITMVQINMLTKIIVMVFTLLLTIAVIFLFFLRFKTKLALYFGLLMAGISLMVLFDPDGAALLTLPIDAVVRTKFTLLIHIFIAIFLLKFVENFLPGYAPKSLYRIFSILFLIYGLLVISLPVSIILEYQFILGIIQIINALIVIMQIVRANVGGVPNSFLLLLAAAAVLNNVVWAFIKHRMNLIIDFYPLDLLIALFLFTGFWICLFLQYTEEIEEKNKKLRLANKSRDDFLANTSHEMRNPLHSMMHIAQYVLDNPENKITKTDRNDLILLVQVGRKMSMLINDLIDLSQIKEHNLRLDKKAVDLHVQIKIVLDMLAHVIEGKPIQIINKVKASFPLLNADENRLNQILLNLLHNAVKFTELGVIIIQAEVTEGMAVIEVTDTGKGIDKEDIERIFLPYEQVTSDDTSDHPGTGIGLAITKELVELQGGTLHVKSKLGIGTTFRFTIALFEGNISIDALADKKEPVIESVVEHSGEVQQPVNQRFRLLLVDDERINLTVVSKLLDRNRYEIIFADNVEEALAYLSKQQFDLVISDVMMPGMSGFDLTREIRKEYNLSELPILLLTARARPEDLEAGFMAGANDYVVKPVEPLELQARVRVLTDLKEAVTEHLRMEAAWLRAQINPHFIFNTINSIFSLMEMDQEKMKDLLSHFIYYLQTSFDFQNANALVSLEQELNLVDAYLGIEKARFGDRIQVHTRIDVDTSAIYIPPLSLQTLVENAVKHGILKHQQGGEIMIEAVYCEEMCEIRIKDSGIGFPKEVKEWLRMNGGRDRTGIGLLNTEKRLKQYAGEGISIDSKPGKGTTIIFRLPC